MSDEEPIRFSVTPYDGAAPRSARRLSRPEMVPVALWLLAAVIAVGANFLEVYRLRYEDTSADQVTIPNVSLGYNGWGEHSFTSADPDFGRGLLSGARWGVLVLICAAALLVAALWSLQPQRRSGPFGPADLAAVGSFGLAGVVAALVVSFGPTRHEFAIAPEAQTTFHWGPCWPVEAGAAVIAVLGWAMARWRQHVSEPDSARQQSQSELEAAMDQPGSPTATDPSPW